MSRRFQVSESPGDEWRWTAALDLGPWLLEFYWSSGCYVVAVNIWHHKCDAWIWWNANYIHCVFCKFLQTAFVVNHYSSLSLDVWMTTIFKHDVNVCIIQEMMRFIWSTCKNVYVLSGSSETNTYIMMAKHGNHYSMILGRSTTAAHRCPRGWWVKCRRQIS